MKKIFNITKLILPISLMILAITSCNKELPAPEAKWVDPQIGATVADLLAADANFSIFKSAVTKAGMMDMLADRKKVFTVFAPSNAAFIASGIPQAAIDALPASTVASIVWYHIIPGQKLLSSNIPTTFPNVQMPTAFIFPAPNTNPLVRFSNFPSKRGSTVYVNNIPMTAVDNSPANSNGVIHTAAAVIAPPSTSLWQAINADPNLTYLVAAINAADAGGTTGSRFQDYLAIPYANFTLFAPADAAFQGLLAYLGLPVSPASFAYLPKQTVQGIVAYHILMNRAFSVNLPTATGVPTLLSASLPTAPLLTLDAAQGAKGAKNATYSAIVTKDKHSYNGVYHVINQVLLPQ